MKTRTDLTRSGKLFTHTICYLEEHHLLQRIFDWATEEERSRYVAAEILADLCTALDVEVYGCANKEEAR